MKKLITVLIIAILITATTRIFAEAEPKVHVMTITILESDWVEFKAGFLKTNPLPKRPPAEGGESVPVMPEDDWVEFRISLWANGQVLRGLKQIAEEQTPPETNKDYSSEIKDRRELFE